LNVVVVSGIQLGMHVVAENADEMTDGRSVRVVRTVTFDEL
jgi:hypothetical protein